MPELRKFFRLTSGFGIADGETSWVMANSPRAVKPQRESVDAYDSNLIRAQEIAEKIRIRIEETPIRTTLGNSFNFTVSIGCTLYDGHPDYQRFLDAADSALYSAKNYGRNSVYVNKPKLK